MPEHSPAKLQELGESIDVDMPTFEQVVEMDDEDSPSFSKDIVFGFFEQAESTFDTMDDAIKREDLDELKRMGHYLKGSSAIIGLNVLKASCEKVQRLGLCMDESGQPQDPDVCLSEIKQEVPKMRKEYKKVEKALRTYFTNNPT